MKTVALAVAMMIVGLGIAGPGRAETVEVYGRNTNTECTDLDQNIAGLWQVENVGGTWRLTKGTLSWNLKPGAEGKWEGDQDWPHYGGVRIIAHVVLTPKTPPSISFKTGWGCRWGTRKPKPVDDDD